MVTITTNENSSSSETAPWAERGAGARAAGAGRRGGGAAARAAVRPWRRAREVVARRARSCGAAADCDASAPPTMATLGLSKVFILDKYFTELQKFWETEKKLQGEPRAAARAATLASLDLVRDSSALPNLHRAAAKPVRARVGRPGRGRAASDAAPRPPLSRVARGCAATVSLHRFITFTDCQVANEFVGSILDRNRASCEMVA